MSRRSPASRRRVDAVAGNSRLEAPDPPFPGGTWGSGLLAWAVRSALNSILRTPAFEPVLLVQTRGNLIPPTEKIWAWRICLASAWDCFSDPARVLALSIHPSKAQTEASLQVCKRTFLFSFPCRPSRDLTWRTKVKFRRRAPHLTDDFLHSAIFFDFLAPTPNFPRSAPKFLLTPPWETRIQALPDVLMNCQPFRA